MNWYNLEFYFADKPPSTLEDTDESSWYAHMKIHAKNIPRLMKYGFHWSPSTVLRGRSSANFHDQISGYWRNPKGITGARQYLIEDRSRISDEKQWVGAINVYSLNGKRDTALANGSFDFNDLSTKTIFICEGLSWKKEMKYWYSSTNPGFCLNSFYGDMPLAGIWPKVQRSTLTKDDDEAASSLLIPVKDSRGSNMNNRRIMSI